MSANGQEPIYRVVAVRKNGERLVILTHSTEEVATKVLNLLQGGDFVDLHIEEDRPSKKPKK